MNPKLLAFCLVTIRLSGRRGVRRALQRLYDAGKITVEDADFVYNSAFGGHIIAGKIC